MKIWKINTILCLFFFACNSKSNKIASDKVDSSMFFREKELDKREEALDRKEDSLNKIFNENNKKITPSNSGCDKYVGVWGYIGRWYGSKRIINIDKITDEMYIFRDGSTEVKCNCESGILMIESRVLSIDNDGYFIYPRRMNGYDFDMKYEKGLTHENTRNN